MAILDKKFELMDAQSMAGVGALHVDGESVLDLGLGSDGWGKSITLDIGAGGNLWLNVRVATAFTYSPAGTTIGTFKLFTHTAAACSVGTLLLTQAMGVGSSLAGMDVLRCKIPAGPSSIARYLQAGFLIGATTISAGALDAWIGLDSESGLPSA